MPLVIRTNDDNPAALSVPGVGNAGANGKGGIVLQDAAVHMPELQDDSGAPLEGAQLRDAAERWAAQYDARVENVKDKDIATLPQEMGAAPDRPPAREVAEQAYDTALGEGTSVVIREGAIVSGAGQVSPDQVGPHGTLKLPKRESEQRAEDSAEAESPEPPTKAELKQQGK